MSGEQRRAVLELVEPRTPPSDLDTEQAVLGTLMMHNGLYLKVSDLLTPEVFWLGFGDIHRNLYALMQAWIPNGKVVNALTAKAQLGDPDLGGTTLSQYLARLSAAAGTPNEIRGYATILHDLYVRRTMISIAEDVRERAYHAPIDDTGQKLVDDALSAIAALRVDPERRKGFQAFASVSRRAVLAAEATFKSGRAVIGLSTGLSRLDDLLGGLRKTDVVVIAGRPAMGKSALAGNVAFNVARALKAEIDAGERRGVVGIFSLEMSEEQFVERMLCGEANVGPWKLRRNLATADDILRLDLARREFESLPLEIDATGSLNIEELTLRARDLAKQKGLELLIIDYLQKMDGMPRHRGNRVQEISEITSRLKSLAKELQIPIVVLSQLSREVERRDDRRPQMADLKESGSIEQDADSVLFIYRDEYYLGKAPPAGTEKRLAYDRKLSQVKGIAEIIAAKNRHGPVGVIELGYDSSLTKFLNEPEPRMEFVEPIRDAPKEKLRVMPEALHALRILQQIELRMNDVTDRSACKDVPLWVKRPIDYMEWRGRVCDQIMDPMRSEAQKATLMEKVCRELIMDLKYAECCRCGDTRYVWLTSLGRKVLG